MSECRNTVCRFGYITYNSLYTGVPTYFRQWTASYIYLKRTLSTKNRLRAVSLFRGVHARASVERRSREKRGQQPEKKKERLLASKRKIRLADAWSVDNKLSTIGFNKFCSEKLKLENISVIFSSFLDYFFFCIPLAGITGKDNITLSNVTTNPSPPTRSYNKIVSLEKEVCMTRYILFRRASNIMCGNTIDKRWR